MDKQLQTVSIYNKHVDEYIEKFMPMDLYNDTYDYLLNCLPPSASIVELGCGPGNVIKYFLTQKPELKILGVDLAPEMLRKAAIINPNVQFKLLDVRNISVIKQKFDAVVLAFCLPYLSYEDLDGFFLNLRKLTLTNGYIYLSCMEGNKEQSGFEKTSFTGENELYIYYHQRENLESKLNGNGFEIRKFDTKDYLEQDGSVTIDLIYIAQKTK